MKLNPIGWLLGGQKDKTPPVLLAVTPPRTGERTLLGVENLLQSIAVPEPFSLELAGDADGVTLMARCRDDEVVKGQISAHYPQARIQDVPHEEDPLRLDEGEEAWSMTLAADGPDYLPLRTFRDDDLLDPGSDPLIALIGALSTLHDKERIVARILLRSLGPDWSAAHMDKAVRNPATERRDASYTYQTKPLQTDAVLMIVLGLAALSVFQGYFWVQGGETWKTVLLAAGVALGTVVAGWGWWRWRKARSRVHDPLLIKEKVSRIAFGAELQVTAILPKDAKDPRRRANELLSRVAAAYRHYDNPAGARFRVGKVRPTVPVPSLRPASTGLFGKRSVLGVREMACLWHPPGARDETPLVERSGARVLLPSARGTRGGALVGQTTAGNPRDIHFPDDLLRRHHLYVARTRMGKSTLMHHIVSHKLKQKAKGKDPDAIVVVDPHTDLVSGLLGQVPESLIDRVRLIDLADDAGAPGINLLDTRIFADRDRTADSVVRVAKGLWDQWGPRMQSILEQTVKTLHEANERVDADHQYTILDGLRLLSDDKFQAKVLAKVSDPYLLEWWRRDFSNWHRQYKAEALAPVQTRLSYYASSKKARAILGQSRSTIDMRQLILDGGVLLVSTYAPFGYRKVSVQDGAKNRPKLELDPPADSVIRRIFQMALQGKSTLDITKTLNGEGIPTSTGKHWLKSTVHRILSNEAYTGTLVWGVDAKDGAPPVRVEDAFPAIITKQEFRRITRSLRSKAPARVNPRRASSPYLLSGLVKCEKCGKALTAAEAKSGKYSYYVCHSLLKRGKGTCKTPRLNSKRFEKLMIEQIRANILTESNIRDLVRLMDEEMDGVAAEQRERLENIEAELIEVRRRLDRVWHVIENSELDISDATSRIREHRDRQEKLEIAAEEARALLSERRAVLDNVDTIAAFAEDMSDFLMTSEITESRAFIKSFVKEIKVKPGKATVFYTLPTPPDSPIGGGDAAEVALHGPVVRSSVHVGGPPWTRTRDLSLIRTAL